MGNMSYCRFHNTYQDLQDCLEHIEDDDLSAEETKYRKWLIETCEEILERSGRLDEIIEENLD
jgi:hypothetical protein